MSEPKTTQQRIDDASELLALIGMRWRMDWNDFDGRTLRSQLNEVIGILQGKKDFDQEKARLENGCNPETGEFEG